MFFWYFFDFQIFHLYTHYWIKIKFFKIKKITINLFIPSSNKYSSRKIVLCQSSTLKVLNFENQYLTFFYLDFKHILVSCGKSHISNLNWNYFRQYKTVVDIIQLSSFQSCINIIFCVFQNKISPRLCQSSS